MIQSRRFILSATSGLALLAVLPASAQEFITVASTTSTENSGLFGHILPMFQQETGIEVRVVSQGTGQALETGRRGDADVVFVHARAQEEQFVAEGYGVQRFEVMYNDFIVVGPSDDPAGLHMRLMRQPPWLPLQRQKRPLPRAGMTAARMSLKRTYGQLPGWSLRVAGISPLALAWG